MLFESVKFAQQEKTLSEDLPFHTFQHGEWVIFLVSSLKTPTLFHLFHKTKLHLGNAILKNETFGFTNSLLMAAKAHWYDQGTPAWRKAKPDPRVFGFLRVFQILNHLYIVHICSSTYIFVCNFASKRDITSSWGVKMAAWNHTLADAISERRKCRDPSRSFKIQSLPSKRRCQRQSAAKLYDSTSMPACNLGMHSAVS